MEVQVRRAPVPPAAHAHATRTTLLRSMNGEVTKVKFLLWCILLVLCWPLALLALVLYPVVWLLLIPFRLLGISVDAVLQFFRALLMLPVRILRGPQQSRA